MKYSESKKESKKNYDRVNDIIKKSNGDKEIQIKLSKIQASRITDEVKAINRALVAKEVGNNDIFEIFFYRAYELGSVSKQDYREYRLSKFNI